ncbi:MAG: class I SAM-dependent methyltransferase [Nocardioidaceae bacterium]
MVAPGRYDLVMLAVPDAVDRERLRCTFDRAAERYHRARPEYPEQLLDDLVRLAELPPHGRLLEIGCGTGKATAPLARRGFHVTCIELGENLASAATSNLARFPDVQIVNASYDVWQPPHRETFDLVFAATSWHWLDPVTRYKRAWELLRPDGFLAFWGATQVFPNRR